MPLSVSKFQAHPDTSPAALEEFLCGLATRADIDRALTGKAIEIVIENSEVFDGALSLGRLSV